MLVNDFLSHGCIIYVDGYKYSVANAGPPSSWLQMHAVSYTIYTQKSNVLIIVSHATNESFLWFTLYVGSLTLYSIDAHTTATFGASSKHALT